MLETLLSYLLIYTYPVLLLITFLDALIVPLPSGSIIMAAGAFSSQGYFSFKYVLIVAILGNILGDIAGYLISFYFGKDFLRRIGLKRVVESKKFISLENSYADHVVSIILLSRFFITGLGSIVNILSGLSKISFKKFLIYALSGEIIYVLFFASLGYIFGVEWENIQDITAWASDFIFVVIAIIILGIIYLKKKKNKKIIT